MKCECLKALSLNPISRSFIQQQALLLLICVSVVIRDRSLAPFFKVKLIEEEAYID
jgi:hypothetical protein